MKPNKIWSNLGVSDLKRTINNITLAKTEKDDLKTFFKFQLDKKANYLAAFTSKDQTTKLLTLKSIQSI